MIRVELRSARVTLLIDRPTEETVREQNDQRRIELV